MIILHKLLPLLVSPLVLALFLGILALILRRTLPAWLAIILVLVASNPLFARKSMQWLENDQQLRQAQNVEPADVVVVLSGMLVAISRKDGQFGYEFNGAVDRFEAGLRLMQQQKARNLIFTRGHLPWSKGRDEGEVLTELAIERGIDPAKIMLTRRVQNTSDEAAAVFELLEKPHRAILVTSAFHMQRAQFIFSQQGFQVDPFPVDFNSIAIGFSPTDLVPQAGAMYGTTFAFRELLGRFYYRLRTWLKK